MLLSYLKSFPSNLSNSKVWCKNQNTSLYSGQTLSRLFMDGREQKGRLIFKICHVYSKIIRLGSYTLPKEDPKNIWIVWHTSWVLARLHISAEVGNFWHYLPIFGLEFESNVVTYEISPLEFLWLQPFCERVKVLKFRPKVPYLGIFGV